MIVTVSILNIAAAKATERIIDLFIFSLFLVTVQCESDDIADQFL